MRNIIFVLLGILGFSFSMNGQVGINTTDPKATLDVRVNDPSTPTAEAGIAIPQVMNIPAAGNRVGQLVINMMDTTYNYFNGNQWVPLYHQVNYIGDLKHGLQSQDHGGWVMLDGRDIFTLSPTQQVKVVALGYTDFLPDASQAVYKSDTGSPLGVVDGSNTIIVSQANLPSLSLSGNTSSSGAHTHDIWTKQDDWSVSGGPSSGGPSYGRDNGPNQPTNTTQSSGTHTHTVSVPLGGSNTPINLNPKFLNANAFLFLGN